MHMHKNKKHILHYPKHKGHQLGIYALVLVLYMRHKQSSSGPETGAKGLADQLCADTR